MKFDDTEAVIDAMIAALPTSGDWFPLKDDFRLIVQAFATAGLQALKDTAKGITISGTILGGASAGPGGPLQGGLLTCLPGTMISPIPLNLAAKWKTPNITLTIAGETRTYKIDTPFLQALIAAVSDSLQKAWQLWFPLWSAVALPVAQGGVVAWVPSTPPAPGPWTAGTVTEFTIAPTIGIGGINASPVLQMIPTATDAMCRVRVFTDQGTRAIINKDAPDGADFVNAIASGLKSMMLDFVASTQIQDPTGAGATGIGAPVTGSITTGVIAGLRLKI